VAERKSTPSSPGSATRQALWAQHVLDIVKAVKELLG